MWPRDSWWLALAPNSYRGKLETGSPQSKHQELEQRATKPVFNAVRNASQETPRELKKSVSLTNRSLDKSANP